MELILSMSRVLLVPIACRAAESAPVTVRVRAWMSKRCPPHRKGWSWPVKMLYENLKGHACAMHVRLRVLNAAPLSSL